MPGKSRGLEISIILPVLALVLIGSAALYSATYAAGVQLYFVKQLYFGIVGIVVAVTLWLLPVQLFRHWAFGIYALALLALGLVLVAGKTVYGARSWLALGGFSVQPAEFAKLAAILITAAYVQRHEVSLQTVRDALIVAIIFGVPVLLVLLQPDFGSASVFVAIAVGMSLWGGMDLLLLFVLVSLPFAMLAALLGNIALGIGAGILVIILVAFWVWERRSVLALLLVLLLNVAAASSVRWVYHSVLKPHQKQRIDAFLDPYTDPYGSGYHVIQSMIAVGSGGFFGKGFLEGTQTQLRYIPKQWTDFIFCVPAEEFGFVGGMLLLGVYGFLFWRLLRLAKRTRSVFGSMLVIGVLSMWSYHVVINVGMALGVVPVVGIPLPFLSAGGSALLVNFAAVGLVLNVARQLRQVG